MPRNRIIKPDFWSDEKIGRLSIPARLLFIGLWNFSDDSGVCRANTVYLTNQIFPYDNIDSVRTHELLSECVNLGLIKLIKYNNETYLEVLNFMIHQKINRPSGFRYIKDSVRAHELLSEGSLTNDNVNDNVNDNDNVNEAGSEAKKKPFVLPDWVPSELWNEFLKAQKKKKTDYAKMLVIRKLERFKNDGQDISEILENSIEGPWSSVYGLKGSETKKTEKIDYDAVLKERKGE